MAIRTWESEEYHSFWQKSDFAYLDRMERTILRKFIESGNWFIDIGGGYGRLLDLYRDRFSNVVISDYSISMLEDANRRLIQEGIRNVTLIAADAHKLPFVDSAFNSAMMVRLIHHIVNPAPVIQEARRILKPHGSFILEYQNKRNFSFLIKARLGLMKRQDLRTLDPYEAGPMYWIFHPRAIGRLVSDGFILNQTLGGGIFWRRKFLNTIFPRLELIDSTVARFLGRHTLTHQIFLKLQVQKESPQIDLAAEGHPKSILDLLKCPGCGFAALKNIDSSVICLHCRQAFPVCGYLYDFRLSDK